MAMRMKKSSTASTSCVWLVMGLMVLLIVSTEFGQVDCRALRSATSDSGSDGGCKGIDGAEEVGMATFAVSSNYNSSTARRPSVRSLAFSLASGPSKKGPGH
ncbi:hypothetical protein PRUPE_1G429100 [Prunus persica]|uniref:Uncharacterized protein n=1 Tax=Prunus persica TaxID=3760 RepID=M5Y9P5_PRUPE|nr:uncharacterized protein LOC18790041 [Prunus persica]ONI33505.1 hypothetical protein PRUPE_1G429100 [Prunus persica]